MAWLPGWGHRVKFTTDNGDIDATLTDFPILIHLSAACGRGPDDVTFIFDELAADANRKKIAVQDDATGNEMYVEAEEWTDAIEEAWLWSKAPTIHADSPDDFYFYFDANHADNNAFVGDTNDAVAESVWDANFKSVYHMRDGASNAAIYDSTLNDNDGTKQGANEPIVTVNGQISDAQVFDNVDDNINCGHDPSLDVTTFTLEAWAKWSGVFTQAEAIINHKESGIDPFGGFTFYVMKATHKVRLRVHDAANNTDTLDGGTALTEDAFEYIAATFNNSTKAAIVYLAGANDGSKAMAWNCAALPATDFKISTPDNWGWKGALDESRVSGIVRTPAHIKATYETSRDDLLAWATQENSWLGKIAGVINPVEIGGVDFGDILMVKGVASA